MPTLIFVFSDIDICVFSDVPTLNIYANNYAMATSPQRMAYV